MVFPSQGRQPRSVTIIDATLGAIGAVSSKSVAVAADKLLGTDSADASQKNFTLATVAAYVSPATQLALGFYNVRNYGAVGDGTTDDSAAIQSAIDAAGASGGTIYFPGPCTYLCGVTGTMTADVLTNPYCFRVTGSHGPITLHAAEGVTLKLKNTQTQNASILLIRAASSAAKRYAKTLIEGFTFDGNQANQTAATDMGLLTVAYSDNVTVRDCVFTNPSFTNLLVFRNSWDAVAHRCTIYQPVDKEGEMRFESPRGLVYGCSFYGDNTHSLGKPLLGLNANTDINVRCDGARVIGNLFVAGKYGIGFGGVSRCVITGNVFRDFASSTSIAIFITSNSSGTGYESNENIIANNEFHNIRSGVQIGGSASLACSRNKIVNNTFVYGPDVSFGAGIAELGSTISDYNECLFNTFVGASAPMGLVNTNSLRLARGNKGYNTSNVPIWRDENGGTAIITAAATTVVVTHGFGRTPNAQDIAVWPTNNLGTATKFWVNTITSTQFTINVDAVPGATTATFAWAAAVR